MAASSIRSPCRRAALSSLGQLRFFRDPVLARDALRSCCADDAVNAVVLQPDGRVGDRRRRWADRDLERA
jgi:hypothetical protein